MTAMDDTLKGVTDALDSIPTIGIKTQDITEKTDIDCLDSVQKLELQVQLENRFDKRISMSRLLEMKTLGDVVNFFKKKKASTDQPA